MVSLSVPIASRLPSTLRIASTSPIATRVLGRLSRPSLLSLALDWLDPGNQSLTAPFLRPTRRQTRSRIVEGADGQAVEVQVEEDDEDEEDEDADDFYPPASSLQALQEHYTALQARKGSKREALDRILEGDWRHGLSMYQLAMADLQYLYDHPTSQKWTAFRIVPLKLKAENDTDANGGDGGDPVVSAVVDKAALVVPRFHPSSFLRNLQAQILPDVKVHYNFDRHKHLPLLLLRIFVLDSPYNTALAATTRAPSSPDTTVETSRTVYVAFPDASPYIYLSSAAQSTLSSGGGGGGENSGVAPSSAAPPSGRSETRSLRSLVVEAIPKALSRPRERYALQPTNLATRNLAELLHRRGAGRTSAAGGGWSIYADEKTIESPLSTLPPELERKEDEGDRETENLADKNGNQAENGSSSSNRDAKKRLAPGTARELRLAKRRKEIAAGRFGLSGKINDGCGVERVDVVLQDPFPGNLRVQDLDVDDTEVDNDGENNDGHNDDNNDNNDDGNGSGDDSRKRTRGQRRSLADDRRQSRGSRRSQIDAALAREADAVEDAEGDDSREDGTSVWRPRVAVTFHGPHVFAGIRQLVEAGVINGEKMPGWMTGEDGVTVGVVRHGRIHGHKGSGMM